MAKKNKSRKQSVSIRELPTVGQQAWEVILRRGGKAKFRIVARGMQQYQYALAAADLWARGATDAVIEKAIGKHINK